MGNTLNYCNNYYENFSPVQEQKLVDMGLPESVISTLDKSLWAILSGDLISKYLTVFEAAELALLTEKHLNLPLISPLKLSLKEELGIIC